MASKTDPFFPSTIKRNEDLTMRKQTKIENIYPEPMYDEKEVIGLRKQVNRLMSSRKAKPYFGFQSNLYAVFHQYAAYSKHKNILKRLD